LDADADSAVEVIPLSHILLALLSLPSQPSPLVFEVGPIALSYHGLLIALGIAVGAWITARELARRGYDGALGLGSLFFVVPLGILGGRLYHVATEYHRYTRNPYPKVLETYDGGLGIYGAVAGGFLGLLLFSWYRGINALTFAGAAAPGLALDQAIGRWGNYFNQELFGEPSDLPWAIRISPLHHPTEFADATSFHPTFLYESLWDVLVCLVLLVVARRFSERLKAGNVFKLYVVLYSVGRFLVETLRVDHAFVIGDSIRGNLLVSGILAVGFVLVLVLRHSRTHQKRSEPG
jgi:phosphatidylglycerol---prolipoprotein diacylglyceryl transferase